MKKMVRAYLESPKAQARKNTKANDDIRRIERILDKIHREIAKES